MIMIDIKGQIIDTPFLAVTIDHFNFANQKTFQIMKTPKSIRQSESILEHFEVEQNGEKMLLNITWF